MYQVESLNGKLMHRQLVSVRARRDAARLLTGAHIDAFLTPTDPHITRTGLHACILMSLGS